MKSRAFVLEECRQDVSAAAQHGKITYVWSNKRTRSSIWSEEFKRELRDTFESLHFNIEKDFLVAVGHQVPLLIAIGEIIRLYGEAPVLMYYPPSKEYVPVIVGGNNTHDTRSSTALHSC